MQKSHDHCSLGNHPVKYQWTHMITFTIAMINLTHSLSSMWAITAAMQSELLTQNDELSDQMTVSAKVSQSICHPGETETHPSSHDTWFIYPSQNTWFPQENVFICFGAMDRTHCWMQMTAKQIKVPELSMFLWVFCLNLGISESLREVHHLICISHPLPLQTLCDVIVLNLI